MADKKPPAAVLHVEPGTRLEQLRAEYDEAKAAEAAAKERADMLTAAIKAEGASVHPGATVIDIVTPGKPALRMSWRAPWRIDEKRLKAEDPVTYVKYAKQGGYWELRAVAG